MGTTKKATVDGQPPKNSVPTSDPLQINARLYNQIGKLLDDLESADRDEVMTTPQRIQALIAVGRVLTIFAALRKGDYDYGNSGSAVRKYAAAFARPSANAARSRENHPRSAEPIDFDSERDDDGDDAA
jgi:hypothetical protein